MDATASNRVKCKATSEEFTIGMPDAAENDVAKRHFSPHPEHEGLYHVVQ